MTGYPRRNQPRGSQLRSAAISVIMFWGVLVMLAHGGRDRELPATRRDGARDAVRERLVAGGHRGEHELTVLPLERAEVGDQRAHRPPG